MKAIDVKSSRGACGLTNVLEKAKAFYDLENFEFDQVSGHDGGRNLVYVGKLMDEKKYVLRISSRGAGSGGYRGLHEMPDREDSLRGSWRR